MNLKDILKFKKELQEKILKNDEKALVCEDRIRLAELNKSDVKLLSVVFSSAVCYIILCLLFGFLSKALGVNFFTNNTFNFFLPYIMAVPSITIGNIVTKFLKDKILFKEKYEAFSKAKTDYGKIQEQTHYEIVLEKLKNKNQILEKTKELLNLEELKSKSKSTFNIDTSNIISIHMNEETINELIKYSAFKRINQVSKLVDEDYKNLDLLTTKKVLSEKFSKIRLKGHKIIKNFEIGLAMVLGGLLLTALFVIPPFAINEMLPIESDLLKLIYFLTSFISGASLTGGFLVKDRDDHERVFDNLNQKLGENKLSDMVKNPSEEIKLIEKLINEKINDISVNLNTIQKLKSYLEVPINSKEKQVSNFKYSKVNTFDGVKTPELKNIENGPALKKTLFSKRG